MNIIRNLFKNFTEKSSLVIKESIVIMAVLIGIIVTVLYGSYATVSEVERQVQNNLADVAKQNAALLETKIRTEYEQLEALSKELEDVTPENIQMKLDHYKIFLDEFNLKRFAYCFPDGMTYSTDGDVTDLEYREFYQAGLQGKCYITGVLSDAIQGDQTLVNVMTKPVYDAEGNVSGVFGLAYDTEQFNEFLQLKSFDGNGYSCIINENYEIMAATNGVGLELSHNMVDVILNANVENVNAVNRITDMVENKDEGYGTLYLSGKNYYYSVPVDLMDGSVTWHVFTIIPADVLSMRVSPIQKNQNMIAVMVVIFALVGAAMIVQLTHEQHKKMLSYAYVDPVTQGANYAKFCAEMKNLYNKRGYLVALDITNFNYITIVAGEDAHNVMIREAWDEICENLHRNELAGHIRDEMFVLFLREESEQKLIERMTRLSKRIGDRAKGFHVYGIHAGYGIYPTTGSEPLENAYSKARIAKEYALVHPETEYAFYSEVESDKLQHEKQLEEMFVSAIENEEFEAWYQPKYASGSGAVVGSEALVRWRKSDGQMISPGEFIPLFERNGMIAKLDEYMFRKVCRQQRKWLDEGRVIYPVSVNISRATLYRIGVEKNYRQIMQEYRIDPWCIQLEVTETIMEDREEVIALLNRFRHMGIKILMDDFGTGYSSLATLSTQCFDTLKLDKTLIDHIGNKDGETILYHIICMGQQMGLHITAEGVERKEQLEFLQRLHCDDIQGFYFARPMPADEYEKVVDKQA